MKLKQRAGYVYMDGASVDYLNEVNDLLTVADPDFGFMQSVTSWDGTHRFFDWERHRFSVGFSAKLGWRFPGPPREEVEASYPFSLKHYQQRGVDELLRSSVGVLEGPTGAGKTAIIAEIVRQAGSLSWLILYQRQHLARQTWKFLQSALDEPVGYVGAGKGTFGRVTVAMAPTLRGKFGKTPEAKGLIGLADGVIVDECHTASPPVMMTLLKRLANSQCTYYYGLSATYPCTKLIPAWKIAQYFGFKPTSTITEEDVSAEIDRPDTYVLEVNLPFEGVYTTSYQQELKEAVYSNEEWNSTVTSAVARLAKHRVSTLVCTENRRVHHRNLLRMFGRSGITTASLHGDIEQEDRFRIIEEVQKGEVDCVLCTTVADYGLDAPNLQVLVDAGTWSDPIIRKQRLGRVRRYKDQRRNIGMYIALVPNGAPRLETACRAAIDKLVSSANYTRITVNGKEEMVEAIDRVFGRA